MDGSLKTSLGMIAGLIKPLAEDGLAVEPHVELQAEAIP